MLEKLQKLVRETSGDDGIVVTGEMLLLTDLGLNSLELIELVSTVEDEFEIRIPERAIRNFKTVQHLLDCIMNPEKVNYQI